MNWLPEKDAFSERIYLLSRFTMLTKSLKFSDTPKKAFMGLILYESDRKISQKHCCADLSSGSDPLTC